MNFLPLGFGAPWLLSALAALPVLWWLLRITPPRPQQEVFPPLRILRQVRRNEEQPSQSPWWLTLLRMIIAALIILALSNPVWNPLSSGFNGSAPVAIVIENGWASAPDWERRTDAARQLIDAAEAENAPLYLAATADAANQVTGPYNAAKARLRLNAIKPQPYKGDRAGTFSRLHDTVASGTRLAWLSDGLASENDDSTFALLTDGGKFASLLWFDANRQKIIALTQSENRADHISINAIRPTDVNGEQHVQLAAFDAQGRQIGEAPLSFAANSANGEATFTLPLELRNDFTRASLVDHASAGATRLFDEGNRRRRVALLATGQGDSAQPLLSPLHYLSRALAPYADLVTPDSADWLRSVDQLLESKPDVFIMADIGTLPPDVEKRLTDWVENGGTLIRFAGPRLAAANEGTGEDDTLLPVKLRRGERSLGGSLSWAEPQHLGSFSKDGPFAALPVPQDVTIRKQLLAEPSIDLSNKTYASLSDGTPLVTGSPRKRGHIVLFHTAPDASWSSLPVSGSFVDMLRSLLTLAATSERTNDGSQSEHILPPYLMLAADGSLQSPAPDTRPLTFKNGAVPHADMQTPAGFYGQENALFALNLLDKDATLLPLRLPALTIPVTNGLYEPQPSLSLRGPLFAGALMLFMLDMLLMLWLQGHLRKRFKKKATALILPFMIAGASLMVVQTIPDQAKAQENRPGDAERIETLSKTRLAYVITGKSDTDEISKAGLRGLSFALADKTTLEPGDPVGVDPAKDELSFYPLIYWPVEADAPMPDEQTIAHIDAYMQQGGSVLFDTRDQLSADAESGSSPANQRLRTILSRMNIPPLEPVPADHVLTKSFFIMPDFPGRFNGSPLWVEAMATDNSHPDRPVRSGDGVSPILITGNDFAGAWAVDEQGEPLMPTIPNDPMQRIYALRGGVNIVMYMLTGNYKADQVHVPALLERLGK